MAITRYELNANNKRSISTKNYTEKIEYKIDIDNTDAGKKLIKVGTGTDLPEVNDFKSICIYNESKVPIELFYTILEYKDDTAWDRTNSIDLGGGATIYRYIRQILNANDFWLLNGSKIVGYNAGVSAGNDTTLDNQVPAANMYLVADASGANEAIDGSETDIDVDDCGLFHVGDLIRIDDEIMEVTAKSAEFTAGTLTVIREVYGSTAATHDITDDLRLPFFNTYYKYDKFSTARTDANGKFHAFNFFGYGRTSGEFSNGLVPGSVSIKFYSTGYQELGLSGITSSTSTGLTAGETYYITIACDGAATVELSVIIDASNTNFGGKNGLMQKLQEAINAKFFVAGGLFEKRVNVGIVDGDIRFTSQQFLSTSAIALTAGASGAGASVRLLAQANGRIPILADINGAVASKLPADTVKQRADNISVKNHMAFMFDDGLGNLQGVGSGRINYETGEIDFKSFPNAEFVINATYNSCLGGGLKTGTGGNTIYEIYARSLNNKIDGKVKIEIYK